MSGYLRPDISDCIGKNIIVSFVDWDISQAKRDYDLMYSFCKTEAPFTPNFLFLKNGPCLIRVESIQLGYLLLYSHNDSMYYLRNSKDVKEVTVFNGTSTEMQEFLYNEEDRRNNPPVYDPVFENDPNGVFGSQSKRIWASALGMTMLKMMAVNLCLKDSVLFDSDFFDRVMNTKQFHQPLSAEILFSSFDADIYIYDVDGEGDFVSG